jgi:nucleolar protein 12
VKKKTLLKEFKQFGEVESVRIRSVPLQDVGIRYWFCFVSVAMLLFLSGGTNLCVFIFLMNQTKKPRKGAILAKKINESAER